MKRLSIGISVLALATFPAFGFMVLPLSQVELKAPTSRFCDIAPIWNEKRPRLNPARAALRC